MKTLVVCGLLLVLWLLLSGSVHADTDTPPMPRQRYTLYFPMWQQPALAGKLGLAGGTVAQANALGASWMYDWSATPPTAEYGIESVPMIGNADRVAYDLGGNSVWILGFNEPDLAVQSNITPEYAAQLWRQIETRYPQRKLVSPAVSDPDSGWLLRFRLAYYTEYGTWSLGRTGGALLPLDGAGVHRGG